MIPKLTEKQIQLYENYLASNKILIADTNQSSRAGLAKSLTELKSKMSNILLADSYGQAMEYIEKKNPKIIFCDFDLGKNCGLDLIQTQRAKAPESKDLLFVLVTGNTSQSTVAQAAEEDVDTYVLKPFTVGTLKQAVIQAVLAKINPSEYHQLIDEGKKLLVEGKCDEAIEVLTKAKGLSNKPTLACFYIGQAELMKKLQEEAKGNFKSGLQFDKIHYKCLVGLYEILMEQKKHDEAYDIVKKLSRYFPANPKRLTQVIRLAIVNRSYDDMERYYQLYKNIDVREEELTRYMCSALIVCGKYYLQSKVPSRALELLKGAAISAPGRTKVFREIIVTLVEHGMAKDAESFLKRFPPESRKEADFLTSELLVSDLHCDPMITIEFGRKVISQGIKDPMIYDLLIRRSAETKYQDAAEELTEDAAKLWPELKSRFQSTLEESLKKVAAEA